MMFYSNNSMVGEFRHLIVAFVDKKSELVEPFDSIVKQTIPIAPIQSHFDVCVVTDFVNTKLFIRSHSNEMYVRAQQIVDKL